MRILTVLAAIVLTTQAFSQQRAEGAFMLWDNLLQKHVDSKGNVDYKGFCEDATFNTVLSSFSMMDPKSESWSDGKRYAFWINVYNAFTIKLICDNYPIKSITDIKDPWKKKWIEINGSTFSLDQIENEILRPQFKDARVHFAINCASISCPRLNNRAFFAENLDRMLTQLARDFINDETRNKLGKEKAEISQIFEWFADDFAGRGGVTGYLNRYSALQIDPNAEISYLEYNWNLNGK